MSDDYQTIKTTASNRKELVRAIRAYTGEKARYIGPPTFAYTVGPYFIYCDCSITAASCHCSKDFLSFLSGQGFLAQQTLQVQFPIAQLEGNTLKNLVFMLHSKQYLLNRAIGSDCFSISDKLITDLQTVQPIQQDSFLKIFQIHSTHCQGISCKDSVLILQFPASNDAAQNQAFTDLAAAMVKKAGESKRISPVAYKPENEKYYFRVRLIQLGLSGPSHKATRSMLISPLKGNSAFRTQEEADAFYAKQKLQRTLQKREAIMNQSL